MAWFAGVSYTFSPSTTAASSQVNQNNADIVAAINIGIPSGIISLWSGSIATIPTGWLLCNGENGTPDLRNKFIMGAGDAYDVDVEGGEAEHTLTEEELAPHTHIQNPHKHGAYSRNTGTGGDADSLNTATQQTYSNVWHSFETVATNQNAGSGAPHNNIPPFYALAYIMKS